MTTDERPWTTADVPPGPYFHGTPFQIEPGTAFDLRVPKSLWPDVEWGLVSDPDSGDDSRCMFWATTVAEEALAWAGRRTLHLRLDRLYVWEVELDNPEVDVNVHSNRWQVPVTSVMAPSGRFIRIMRDIPLAEYQGG